jgi:hypothetical protein
MEFPRRSFVVSCTAFFAVAPCFVCCLAPCVAQAAQQGVQPTGGATYVDDALPKLQKAVPALVGLKPDANQEDLPYILNSIAGAIADFVPRLPNLVSREEVYRSENAAKLDAPHQYASLATPGVAGPMAMTTIKPQEARGQEFRYLILCNRNEQGTHIEESRTDSKGHPLTAATGASKPLGSGFAYQWLLFSAANQSEFRFRYLGEQMIDGRKTYVVAFAQTPERVKIPAVFRSRGKEAPYYYQGILWADQETFNIALLRTDLLTPLRSLQLFGLTTELHFRAVQIHGVEESFWLPDQVDMFIAQDTTEIEELHEYTNYRLFHSTATIVPAPKDVDEPPNL